jgi:general secretion pathway protein F
VPVYEYEALLKSGRKQKGVVEAESEAALRARLRSEGQYPVSIRVAARQAKRSGSSGLGRKVVFERVKSSEIHLFARHLSTLLGAGIPLDAALASIIEQADNQSYRRVVAQIKESVKEGESFSGAIQRFPKLFSNMFVNMVRAGEASGALDRVLSRLADFGEKQTELKNRLRAAMVYPFFMALIGVAILFVLVTYVVPKITQVFDTMERALPLPTVVLLSISSFFQNYWWLLLIGVAGVVVGVRMAIRHGPGREVWDLLMLRAPVFGIVMRKSIMARFSSTMESLLVSGVGLIDALEITKRIIDNVQVNRVIDKAIEDVRKGRTLAHGLSGSPWFTPLFLQMISVGETSGHLEQMLEKMAHANEREVESAVFAMTSLIEPVMIVCMGGVVGFIVLAIMLPILETSQMIG